MHTPNFDQGFYTLDARCEYESSDEFVEVTTIRRDGANVWCDCDIVNINRNGLQSIRSLYGGTCALIITRCPLSQNLFN